ncbi:MAG: superoxide dismutase family protein [Hyphomonadaceae bacterium]|nr:superoxide dismutase family protein [Hyphomonadaceae bacterium]
MRIALAASVAALAAACTPPSGEPAQQPSSETMRVDMSTATADGTGASVGVITISQTTQGATFALDLRGLPPGDHGFHVHEHGSCAPHSANGQPTPAGAAGAHWDPDGTGVHLGPEEPGHLGDLPLLQITDAGRATQTLTAPRITDVARLRGRALMIHAGGDNYSDMPAPNGGGGDRIACGVIG